MGPADGCVRGGDGDGDDVFLSGLITEHRADCREHLS